MSLDDDTFIVVIWLCVVALLTNRVFYFTIIFAAVQIAICLSTYLIQIPKQPPLFSPFERYYSAGVWFEEAPLKLLILATLISVVVTVRLLKLRAEPYYSQNDDFYFYLPPVSKAKNSRNWWNWRGLLYSSLAICVALFLLLGRYGTFGENISELLQTPVINIVFLIFGVFGIAAMRWTKPSARKLMEIDARPPNFILRSYDDEKSFDSFPNYFNIIEPTFEASLSRALSNFGPTITLANPEKRRPYAGVAIDRVTSDSWMENFSQYSERAGLVIFLVGYSPGIVRELQHLLERDQMYKTILMSPPGERRRAGNLWSSILKEFGENPYFEALEDLELERVRLMRWSVKGQALIFTSKGNNEVSCVSALNECLSFCQSRPPNIGLADDMAHK